MAEWTLFALPGFLGTPQDWEILLQQNPTIISPKIIDLFSSFPIDPLWDWAKQFNAFVQKSPQLPRVILGYSLGGRLALHALIQNPTLWHAAIIVSTHPGFKHSIEKQKRLKLDEHWAQRFEHDPWDTLMRDWNARSVFEHDPFFFHRQEKDYSRATLAKALRQWSLGHQDNLHPEIRKLQLPLLWVTGAKDARYSSLANQIILTHPFSKVFNVPEAGHRVPWQQPEIFHDQLNQFLEVTLCRH